MKKFLLSLTCAAAVFAGQIGIYNSVDEDGKTTATWEIYEQDGMLFGKILKLVGHPDDTICKKCSKTYKGFNYTDDASKMKLVGAPLLYNVKKKSADKYEDGYIIDPKSGKQYHANVTLKGDTLVLRGYIGFSMIGRNQTWVKAK